MICTLKWGVWQCHLKLVNVEETLNSRKYFYFHCSDSCLLFTGMSNSHISLNYWNGILTIISVVIIEGALDPWYASFLRNVWFKVVKTNLRQIVWQPLTSKISPTVVENMQVKVTRLSSVENCFIAHFFYMVHIFVHAL